MGRSERGYCGSVNELQSALWLRLLDIPGTEEGENSWGDGLALWVNAKQVANFTAEDVVELRLTKAMKRTLKARLIADERVHFRGASSHWLSVRFEKAADVDFVAELAGLAAVAHLPADGTAPKPPPTGAAMERRKRFH